MRVIRILMAGSPRGMALAQNQQILAHVAMPIAGMLSDQPAAELAAAFRKLRGLSAEVADWEPPSERGRDDASSHLYSRKRQLTQDALQTKIRTACMAARKRSPIPNKE